MDKQEFLRSELTKIFSSLAPDKKGKWGKMNAQQMVEHMSYSIRVANGRHSEKPVYSTEITQKGYNFIMTEKPFRENTPNQLLPDEPPAVKHSSMADSIAELQSEIDYFFKIYLDNRGMRTMNPFFGNLNFEEQVQLLHKHATHHAKQFGLAE